MIMMTMTIMSMLMTMTMLMLITMLMKMTNMMTMTICSESEFLGENCHLSELSEEGEEENQLKVSKFETFLEPFDQFDIIPGGEGRQEGRYVGGEQKVDLSSLS